MGRTQGEHGGKGYICQECPVQLVIRVPGTLDCIEQYMGADITFDRIIKTFFFEKTRSANLKHDQNCSDRAKPLKRLRVSALVTYSYSSRV
jgi:hypothetical protein